MLKDGVERIRKEAAVAWGATIVPAKTEEVTDRLSPNRDMKPEPTEYKARIPKGQYTTRRDIKKFYIPPTYGIYVVFYASQKKTAITFLYIYDRYL